MVWIDSIENSTPLLIDEDILEVIDINHTSLIAVLTPTSIILLNQYNLLPVGVNTRSAESIRQHGTNLSIKTKEINVNYHDLQKLAIVNIFCQTVEDYIIIYQVAIDSKKSIYEVHDANSSSSTLEILQKNYPTSYSNSKFSIQSILKNVKNLLTEPSINLENIESFNNFKQEEDKLNSNIEYVKISVYKIIKIAIGIEKIWIKPNSHNLFVYNNHLIQIINIKNLNNEIINLQQIEWYNGNNIKFIDYWSNSTFIFVNELNEIWLLNVEELEPTGYKFDKILHGIEGIKFNPIYDLLIIYQKIESNNNDDNSNDGSYSDDSDDSEVGGENEMVHSLKLYKFENQKLIYLQKIKYNLGITNKLEINWSVNGKFFVVLNDKGYWTIISKFGNGTTNTLNISNELNFNYLLSSNVLIASNCLNIYLINNSLKMLYKINLTKLINDENLILVNSNYLSILNNNSKLIKFPMLPNFKKILNNFEDRNCNYKISINEYNQFIISFGKELSVSTPFKNFSVFHNNSTHYGDKVEYSNPINHVIWFNFKNHYIETLNIVNHTCYRNYLIIVNRTVKEINNKDHIIDELVILNIEDLKFGNGGNSIQFDSDLIVWRQKLNNVILTFELKNDELIILEDNNFKIIIFKLSEKIIINDNFYKFYIKVTKTIYLNNLPVNEINNLDFKKVKKLNLVDSEFNHIIFLLNNGDFYLLKNQSNRILLTNYYQLIKLNEGIENFKIDMIKFMENQSIKYIYLFKGNSVIIYNLTNLIELSFDQSIHIKDGIEDIELPSLIQPIVIDYNNYQPLKIFKNDTTINLIGIQDLVINKNLIKLKVNYNLILNNLIEFDLINNIPIQEINQKFSKFNNFNYCLELLLFKYLTNERQEDNNHNNSHIISNANAKNTQLLTKLINLIDDNLLIFINCLRKIELHYWPRFFTILGTTPLAMMSKILNDNNVELCYNFLIIYLNSKKDSEGKVNGELDNEDKVIIVKILKLLDHETRWDWCFELCRFVKLLDPSSDFLKDIRQEITIP